MKMTKPDFDAKKQPKKLKRNAKIYQKSMWTCQKIPEEKLFSLNVFSEELFLIILKLWKN